MASQTVRAVGADVLTEVRSVLAGHVADPVPGLPPFQGGAAGYLAYDWGRTLERLPECRYDDLALPDVVLGIYDWVVAWDHDESRAWLISTGLPETSADGRTRRAEARAAGDVQARLRHPSLGNRSTRRGHERRHRQAHTKPCPRRPRIPFAADGGIRGSRSGPHSRTRAISTRSAACANTSSPATSSRRISRSASRRRSPSRRGSCTCRMRQRNAAPFAAYFDTPDGEILSASPERFLRVDVDGRVETRPIKGTRPRGIGPEHDGALGRALTESAKDRAENLMIVDLMRNDLSRVCSPGTRARAGALRARALRDRAPPRLDRRRTAWRRAPMRSICCGPPFRAARSPARRRCARWRSSPSSSRRSAACTAARSATGA